MKDKTAYIEIKDEDKKYPICFNINVMNEFQDKYGSMTEWGNIILKQNNTTEPRVKEVIDGLTIMMNEAIDAKNDDLPDEKKEKFLTNKQVGRIISKAGLANVTETIQALVIASSKDEDKAKNV